MEHVVGLCYNFNQYFQEYTMEFQNQAMVLETILIEYVISIKYISRLRVYFGVERVYYKGIANILVIQP